MKKNLRHYLNLTNGFEGHLYVVVVDEFNNELSQQEINHNLESIVTKYYINDNFKGDPFRLSMFVKIHIISNKG